MIIYSDRITVSSLFSIRSILKERGATFKTVQLRMLDTPNSYAKLIMFILKLFRIDVCEEKFFASDMHKTGEEAILFAAIKIANDEAVIQTKEYIEKSSFLSKSNDYWGRNTLFKHLSQQLQFSLTRTVLHALVAQKLSESKEEDCYCLLIKQPTYTDNFLQDKVSHVKLKYYQSMFHHCGNAYGYAPSKYELLRKMRGAALFYVSVNYIKEIAKAIKGCLKKSQASEKTDLLKDLKSLLILQDDEVGMDRSYRTQPHWLFESDGKPDFRTVILQVHPKLSTQEEQQFKKWNIDCIHFDQNVLFSKFFFSKHEVVKKLRGSLIKTIFVSFFGNRYERSLMFSMAQLTYFSMKMGQVFIDEKIKSFMTCENYSPFADAALLITPKLNIHSMSYQYSNLSTNSPGFMTSVDQMLTFSDHYHSLWQQWDITPTEFKNIGYLYSSSFSLLEQRARELRGELKQKGVGFVVAYFDENIAYDKFYCTKLEDHLKELEVLYRWVLEDETMGLVVKTQFNLNLPDRFKSILDLRDKVLSTGRYKELSYGKHRNIIFPAEAALASDMTIGHAYGATASLEAALCHVRSVLINPWFFRGKNTDIYQRADIVFDSLEDAKKAIVQYKDEPVNHSSVGNWNPILKTFDAFEDHDSAIRMRNIIEQSLGVDKPLEQSLEKVEL